MPKKSVFVPKAGMRQNSSMAPKVLLGRIFIALSIGVVFVLLLSLIWRQNAQPPIGDDKDAGKPIVYKEIPKTTVPQPQVVSLEKVVTSEMPKPEVTASSPEPETKTSGQGTPAISPPPSGSDGSPMVSVQGKSSKTTTSPPVSESAVKTPSQPQTPASMPPKPPEARVPASSWIYAVQVGAYSKKENAQEALERLKKMGFTPQISPFNHPKLGPLYAVRVAPFASQGEAQKAAEKIAAVENEKPIIVKTPASH
ncbi:MAG: SPOR domain-containing protein [Desulfosoma sp.]